MKYRMKLRVDSTKNQNTKLKVWPKKDLHFNTSKLYEQKMPYMNLKIFGLILHGGEKK